MKYKCPLCGEIISRPGNKDSIDAYCTKIGVAYEHKKVKRGGK